MQRFGKSVFQTEGTAEAKALGQDWDGVFEDEERGQYGWSDVCEEGGTGNGGRAEGRAHLQSTSRLWVHNIPDP